MECFRAYSSGMLSSVFQRNAFERIPVDALKRIPVECFGAYSSGMLSSVFQWNAFERIPVSGVFSSVFRWNAFESIPVNAFDREQGHNIEQLN